MNASSAKTSPRPSRSKARNCVILNQLATPGLGTYLSGRKITGALQMLAAVSGFVLIMIWYVGFMRLRLEAIRDDQTRLDPGAWTCALWGLGLFAGSWLWAGISSLSILKQSTSDTPSDVPPRLGTR